MIMNAQKSRGMDFGEGNLVQKVKSVIPILIPLFVSSFRRADDLAIAMVYLQLKYNGQPQVAAPAGVVFDDDDDDDLDA